MASHRSGEADDRGDALTDVALAMQAARHVLDVQSGYLDTATALVRADAYGFTHFDAFGERLVPLSVLTREAPDGLVPAYNALGANHDPMLAAARSADAPVDSSRVLSPAEWRDSSLCDVLGRHGLHHTMVVPLTGERSALLGTLYFARGIDERPFSAADLSAMSVAKRHVEVALNRAMLHDSLDQRTSVLGWAFNQLDVPTVVSAGDQPALFENSAVRRLLRANRHAREPLAEMIDENVSQLTVGRDRTVARSRTLPSSGGGPDEFGLRLTVRSTALRRGSDAVISFVFVRRNDVAAPVDHTPLSAREREIVAWVAEGSTNQEIARLAFVSENTVRQHLKRIFRKLNVHSRAELVQAIWQSRDDFG